MKQSEILTASVASAALLGLLLVYDVGAATANGMGKQGSYAYLGGKSKDLTFSSPALLPSSPPAQVPVGVNPPGLQHAATSLAASGSYYEPRGDYGGGGGGYGGGGGGGGGWGSGGGGGNGIYHYVHQPNQYYHPAPMYYDDGGGFDGSEKGLIGLLGLTGLKGLLGLLGLAKLLLPLLGLLLPLLLPLLLLKALALLALLLLIPVPVITTGTAGRKLPTTYEEGKAYLKETLSELVSKIPADLNQIVSKIKDSSAFAAEPQQLKKKEVRISSKQLPMLLSGKSSSSSSSQSDKDKDKTT